ncbi:MAG: hypothetical protein GY814_11170 [Gammaproteobacteria bacterium]|nr:hypothetical protein [Gammaproteobacteria bacterium]
MSLKPLSQIRGPLLPAWFTTDRKVSDASYTSISINAFHSANVSQMILAHFKYGGSRVGIMRQAFVSAIEDAEKGVLVVGPPEMAAQLSASISKAIIFTLKDLSMDLSPHLREANSKGQLHRVDVDVLEPGAWTEVYSKMMDILGI